MNRNELWARVLLDELARAGVRELTVSPGSRSTPLVLAAAADRRFRMVVQLDERSAGFFALGVGKATGRPAGVITTSGTAVANLHPAVVEASQSEVPLLLLTADRPPHLRGADANQAIDQTHIFGRYVRGFHELSPAEVSESTLRHLRSSAARAVAQATGDPAGPVHLNLPFSKPLEPAPEPGYLLPDPEERSSLGVEGRPGGRPFTRILPRRGSLAGGEILRLTARMRESKRPLLIAGPVSRPWEIGPLLRGLPLGGRVPLLADPLSGARFGNGGAGTLGGYDLFLRDPALRRALAPDLVLRVGATPTSTTLAGFLEENAGVEHWVVDGGGRWKDHLTLATEYLQADPVSVLPELLRAEEGGINPESGWFDRWWAAERDARDVLDGLGSGEFFEGVVLQEALAGTPAGSAFFVSNSMPVRDLDAFVHPDDRGPIVLGNRGASGIDGIVSTAAGAAFASERPVVAVLGDLALLHDQNGLLGLRDSGARVVFVVVNNDGGGIFHHLPIRGWEPEFTRYFATPHGREPERVAALFGLDHHCVDGQNEGATHALRLALAEAIEGEGSVLLEVRTDRDANLRRRGEVTGGFLGMDTAPGS